MHKHLSFIGIAMALFILRYDAMTHVLQRVQYGSIIPRVEEQYTNVRTKERDDAGVQRNLAILRNQYSSAVRAACKMSPIDCTIQH